MGSLIEIISSNHKLSKKNITLVYNFNNSNYTDLVNTFSLNSPLEEMKEKYSFNYLNNLFLRNKRIKEMPKNINTKFKTNIFLYDFDIFNLSYPTHSIKTLDMIVQKYTELESKENKVLIFTKPNAKFFDKGNMDVSIKLINLIKKINIIDILRL